MQVKHFFQRITAGFLLLLFGALLLPCFSAKAEEKILSGSVADGEDCVNVYSGPGGFYPVIGTLPAGSGVTVTDAFCTKGWHEIRYMDGNGYIFADYMRFDKPEGPVSSYSEQEKYIYLFQSDVTAYTSRNKPEGYRTKKQAFSHMEKITVPVWKRKRNGRKVRGKRVLYVNALLKDEVSAIFDEILSLPEQFPVSTLVGFRWSKRGEVSGPLLENSNCMSAHAYGAAIDINYMQNDYYVGKGQDLRDSSNPYYITENVIKVFEKHGWFWGGDFSICSDTMHFQYTGLESLSYNKGSPFVNYSVTKPYAKDRRIRNIQKRLKALGYRVNCNGKYTKKTEQAVTKFRMDHGLPEGSGTDEDFYVLLYNMTAWMFD